MSPGLFSRIRVIQIPPNGIMIYGGRLRATGKSATQSYRFPKDKFTAAQARKWLKDHKIKFISFERASGE